VAALKTRRQQRRSTVGFVLWSGIALTAVAAVIHLGNPEADGLDRLFGIGWLAAAIGCAYWAGRWREL